MGKEQTILETTWEHVRAYCETRVRTEMLKAVEKLSAFTSEMIYIRILAVVFILCLIFGSVALAFFIADVTGRFYIGFLSVTAFYVLVLLLMFLVRNSLTRLMQDKMVGAFLKQYHEKSDSAKG